MQGVSVLLVLGCCAAWATGAFLNHRPFPTYSLENMPDTEFSCRDKILGGYYADAETQCQMFHVCVKVAGVGVQDFRFLCPNGTAFDQDHQICAEWEDVDCDATTLYYSSDNFDLYRLGSGFESKAVKYGEDEETFSLQRAETGDARVNREHQSQRVNQQRDNNLFRNQNKKPLNNNNNNQNSERDIFKASSSSNFFNNRNNGKENDEDYDDNVNANQDNDYAQRRKVNRKIQRRPVQQQNNDNQNYNQQSRSQQNNQNGNRQANTERPQRPTGFVNNFAGSSYIPTTSRPTTTTQEQHTTTANYQRTRNSNRQRVNQYNNADDFRQNQQNTNSPSPTYTVSTPAPFRQTQQYNSPPARQTNNNNNNGQYYTTTPAPKKQTENYPQQKPKPQENYPSTPVNNYNSQYDVPKVKQTENYPTTAGNNNYNQQYDVPKAKPTTVANNNYNNQQYDVPKVKPNKATTPNSETENYPSNNPQYNINNKKPTTPYKQPENYPTTFSPKAKPFSVSANSQSNYPTTFAPRTNAGYTQISKQTTQYNNQYNNNNNNNNQNTSPFSKSTPAQNSQAPFAKQFSNQANSTPRTTPFTQYTPTVPKITSTTPVSRSSRFDETQYDDGSYNSKYDYDGDKRDDEFLKTAHSQNIASSRNELNKQTQKAAQQTTQKPYYESPRPFSVSPNTPKAQQQNDFARSTTVATTKNTPRPQEQPKKPVEPPKSGQKTKDASYDYAYYDTNASSEPDYEIDTEFKKSTVKN